MKSNIVVFGKNGQISSNLINLFKAETFNVSVYSSAEVDFSKLLELENFLSTLKVPSFIINCAAYTNVDKAEEEKELSNIINHKAVEVLAKYCAKNGVKLIHYSTDYVFDGSGTKPFEIDNVSNLNPLNYYGKTKLWSENAIINSRCDHLIIRVSWLWDPNPNFKNFFNTIKRLAKEREILTIVDDQIGSPTPAVFVAKKTIEIIKSNKIFSGINHLNNGEYISWYDFAVRIIGDLKEEGEILKVKEINPVKTSSFKTKAKRPLNSRLKNNIFNLERKI